MLRSFYFGQYSFKNSVIHKIDPRLKLLYIFVLSVLVFIPKNISQIVVFSLAMIILIIMSKIGFIDLTKRLRPFYTILIFILMMYLIFSRDKFSYGLVVAWRFLMLIILSSVLTFTTTLSGMITAIEKLARPLKLIGISPRNIALMISVAVRFIPVMFMNLSRTRDAMLARNCNMKKLKNIRLLMIVLLQKMLKSASNLSDAMRSRLYNENLETRKILKLYARDYLSALFLLIFFIIII
jgi:energy-coupling factor transport system permease protein